ncbi:MAG: hypothetical protein M3P24_11940 [Gemmatimonadota bacterium]|nr:hypothetical protein [Gemmatimonadota bacterium]
MYDVRTLGRAGVLALALGAGVAGAARPGEAQSWRTFTSARQLHGQKGLDVAVEYGAGKLTVAPADRAKLYDFRLRYDAAQFTPVSDYDPATGRLRLSVQPRDRKKGARVDGIDAESRAQVRLTPEIPTALDLRFGAGEADVDLGGMALRSLRVSTGASETRVSFKTPNRVGATSVEMEAGAASFRATGLGNARAERFEFEGGVGETVLDFGGTWTRSATATIRMGIGSLTLRLPRGVGVRVVKESFMTSFDGEGLVKRDGAFYSRNWDRAPHKLTVNIEAALGSIDVDWIN